jgi:surface carbohydrate biosynthesis protein
LLDWYLNDMSKPRIALFVANHTRDLPGLVLTARELCRRGAICYLIPYREGRDEIWALAPDFVLLPVIRPYQAKQARQFVDAGIQFGLLDTEGVVWSSMEEYKQTLWNDTSLTRQANCICLWGPRVADHTVSDGIFDRNQTYVTGCPRFDYYSEPLASVYRKPANGVKRQSVLLNTNFTTANLEGVGYPEVIDNYVATYGFPREEVLRWYNNELEAIEGMSQLANQLARDFPEIDVILRPHPEEAVDTYTRKLDGSPNLHLSKSRYVAPWILGASAIIQRSCTTAIEASLAGRPAFSPRWIPAPNFYPVPESVSLPCDDYDQLKGFLAAVFAGEFRAPESVQTKIDSVVNDWFHKTDGLAHRRVADAILSSLSSNRKPDRSKCIRMLHKLPGAGFPGRTRLGDAARYYFNLSPRFSFRKMESFHMTRLDPFFNETEIGGLLQSLAEVQRGGDVKLSRANDCGAYVTRAFRGRAFVMEGA